MSRQCCVIMHHWLSIVGLCSSSRLTMFHHQSLVLVTGRVHLCTSLLVSWRVCIYHIVQCACVRSSVSGQSLLCMMDNTYTCTPSVAYIVQVTTMCCTAQISFSISYIDYIIANISRTPGSIATKILDLHAHNPQVRVPNFLCNLVNIFFRWWTH